MLSPSASPTTTSTIENSTTTNNSSLNNLYFINQTEHFAIVFLGGAVVGLAIAAATHRLHALMNDPFSETALTVATVFGSVAAANSLGLSGLVGSSSGRALLW